MKTLILFLIIISFNTTASELCKQWADIAEMSAKSRQEHKPLDVLLANIEKSSFSDTDKHTFTIIMKQAHSFPIVPSIEDKLALISDFGDVIFLQCLNETAKPT